jgi:hypothetical protein
LSAFLATNLSQTNPNSPRPTVAPCKSGYSGSNGRYHWSGKDNTGWVLIGDTGCVKPVHPKAANAFCIGGGNNGGYNGGFVGNTFGPLGGSGYGNGCTAYGLPGVIIAASWYEDSRSFKACDIGYTTYSPFYTIAKVIGTGQRIACTMRP